MEPACALLRCSDRFRGIVSRMGIAPHELEDVMQEALLQIWLARGQIDPSANVLGWAYRVVANQARDHLRRARRCQEVAMPFDDDDDDGTRYGRDLRDDGADPEANAVSSRRIQVLRHLIQEIDPTRRVIFVEHELLGRPLQDIAAEQGIRFETARGRLSSAWEEFRRAGKRWQARHGGRDTEPGGMLPVAPDGGTSILRRGQTQHMVSQGLTFAVGLVVVAASLSSIRAPYPVTLSPLPALPLPALPPPTAEATTVTSSVPAQAAAPSAWMARNSTPRSATEASLIAQVEMFLGSCMLARAREALAQHEREYPEGRLSSKREELRKRLDASARCGQ